MYRAAGERTVCAGLQVEHTVCTGLQVNVLYLPECKAAHKMISQMKRACQEKIYLPQSKTTPQKEKVW
jgi:hypothetical protein